jgi:hypothetical protein
MAETAAARWLRDVGTQPDGDDAGGRADREWLKQPAARLNRNYVDAATGDSAFETEEFVN